MGSHIGSIIEVTGSAVPADSKEITHSGTGRFTWLTMRLMSLYESGDSGGDVSLKALFDGETEVDADSSHDIDRLAFLVCRGGWPRAVDMRDEIALEQAMDYYDAVVRSDINRADNVQKNPERVRRLIRSYAGNQGGQVPNTVLAQDIAANDEAHINEESIYCRNILCCSILADMSRCRQTIRVGRLRTGSDAAVFKIHTAV